MSAILHILQHSLGRDRHGLRKRGVTDDYRNRFVTGPECDDWATCTEAVDAGLMWVSMAPSPISGGHTVFSVTDAGKRYIAEHSPPAPRLTKSQSRYRRWLDADCGMPFGQWIREAR